MEVIDWKYILVVLILLVVKGFFITLAIRIFNQPDDKEWWVKKIIPNSFDLCCISTGFVYTMLGFRPLLSVIFVLIVAASVFTLVEVKKENEKFIIQLNICCSIAIMVVTSYILYDYNINKITVELPASGTVSEPVGQPGDQPSITSDEPQSVSSEITPGMAKKDSITILIYDATEGVAANTTDAAEKFQDFLRNNGYMYSRVRRLSEQAQRDAGASRGLPSRYKTFLEDKKEIDELTHIIKQYIIGRDKLYKESEPHHLTLMTATSDLVDPLLNKNESKDKYDMVVIIGLKSSDNPSATANN